MSLWDTRAAILGAVVVAWAALPHQKVRGQAKTWTNGLGKLEEMLTVLMAFLNDNTLDSTN
jgi:hypothetical protein